MHPHHYYTRIVAHVLQQYTRCGQCTYVHMCAQTRAITLIASGCRGDSEPRPQKRLIIFNETADYARGAFSLQARARGSWRHARLCVNNSAACRRDTYARLLNSQHISQRVKVPGRVSLGIHTFSARRYTRESLRRFVVRIKRPARIFA